MKPCIDRIVSTFLQSEYFANWQAEHIDSGSYSRNADKCDRFLRCYGALEHGADGSTHRERIHDMRMAFQDWLRYGRSHKQPHWCPEFPYRVESAVLAHFDALEQWHTDNGSIDEEIG
jgi:hypothetical protein